jgi:hypothetical protein
MEVRECPGIYLPRVNVFQEKCMNIEELQVKVRNKGVIVRTDGRNCGDNLTQLELVQNGSLCREAGTTKRS